MIGQRRIGRPGLIGTAARTAVIAGTAQAVSGNVARRQQRRAADQAQQAYAAPPQQAYAAPPQQAAPAPAAPASGGAGDDMMAKLSQLADMRANGLLSEEEFAAAKARLLG
ncbi:SHOCT domain-containing protein [Nocardioides sp. GY 10113]|uniref:SHOCT domain-containing protein n=1 Tax=Nocardioides sp. GY 10113 TaxID=2569761 RepID=UPI0010A8803B|nr:SHOCT domain-containing protein [Nocardioides sp. GY 10113]TIC80641.1 SHOCT domain-containing protein [Nocardioides sp. GY 10113]